MSLNGYVNRETTYVSVLGLDGPPSIHESETIGDMYVCIDDDDPRFMDVVFALGKVDLNAVERELWRYVVCKLKAYNYMSKIEMRRPYKSHMVMTGPVGGRTGSRCLPALSKIFRLTTEGSLINSTLFGSGKWQPHMLQLKDRLGPDRAHVLNSVLITNVVRPLYGVIHMPAPVILRICTSDRTGNAALRRDRVGTGREYL